MSNSPRRQDAACHSGKIPTLTLAQLPAKASAKAMSRIIHLGFRLVGAWVLFWLQLSDSTTAGNAKCSHRFYCLHAVVAFSKFIETVILAAPC